MNDDITPRSDIQQDSQQTFTGSSVGEKLLDKARGYGATSMYLAAFAMSPVLLVFNDWIFLPALALSFFILWRGYELKKQGIDTVVLRTAAFLMLFLSIGSFVLWSSIKYGRYSYFDISMNEFILHTKLVVPIGVILLMTLGIMAIVYGVKSKRIAENSMAKIGIILGSAGLLLCVGMTIWSIYQIVESRSGASHDMLWSGDTYYGERK